MISIDPYNQKKNNENNCLICHDKLCNENSHKLECNHEYHVDCIISWFRSGNINCPYCNATPENCNINYENYYYSKNEIMQKYLIIKKYSKKKECPVFLKKKIESIIKNENKLEEIKNQIKEINNEVGTYSDIVKKHRTLKSNLWNKSRIILKKKRELISTVNIIPLTIINPIKKYN